jgi:hypothetical protein
MGRVSLSRLLRPLLWLLWLALLPLASLLMIAMTPLFLVVWAFALPLSVRSSKFRDENGMTPLGMALCLPLWPVVLVSTLVPALALAHGALLYLDAQSPVHVQAWLDSLNRDLPAWLRLGADARHAWAWLCVAAGATGFGANVVYLLVEVPWRLKQLRLVRALPRSKARSAAMGLAEFQGRARMVTYGPRERSSQEMELQPFRLEDETGWILVDPRGVAVRPWGVHGLALHVNEVAPRVREGDPVYVIGSVQPRLDGPAEAPWRDAPVVRPLGQALASSPVMQLLFTRIKAVADRQSPNLFIVDKGPESDVVVRIRMALWDFCAISVIYAAASLWLVAMAWPWLR